MCAIVLVNTLDSIKIINTQLNSTLMPVKPSTFWTS